MHPHQTAFAKAPTAGTSAASEAGLGAAFGGGQDRQQTGRRHGGRQANQHGDQQGDQRATPFAGDIVAPTLSAIVAGLVAVRAQIHTLHAVEATRLALGDSIADEVATREQHTDHGDMEHRALAAEFAAAVHESDRTMAGRIARAVTLVQDYPTVHNSLETGSISQVHANLITDAGLVVTDPTARSKYAAAALEIALVETPGRVRPLVKELAERFTTRTLDERHQEARTCRMVRVVELGDGMADLTATLPAIYAYGIKDRLNQMARAVKQHEHALADEAKSAVPTGTRSRTADDTGNAQSTSRIVRSMDQIRADLLTDLLLASDPNAAATSGNTGIAGIQARVQVIVPKVRLGTNETEPSPEADVAPESADQGEPSEKPSSTTTAPTDHATDTSPGETSGTQTGTRRSTVAPATLAGYGPIDTHTARQLAGQATHWENITINPDTGAVISVDTYRPNTKLRQFLRARDLHCRFPGCHTPTMRCDIDHTIDAAHGGPTTSTNLAHLCRRHHTLKHHTRWAVTQAADGTLTWTSPLGTPYTERPPSTVKFRPVPESREGPSGSKQSPEHARSPAPMPF